MSASRWACLLAVLAAIAPACLRLADAEFGCQSDGDCPSNDKCANAGAKANTCVPSSYCDRAVPCEGLARCTEANTCVSAECTQENQTACGGNLCDTLTGKCTKGCWAGGGNCKSGYLCTNATDGPNGSCTPNICSPDAGAQACPNGYYCNGQMCEPGCASDTQCGTGRVCMKGTCIVATSPDASTSCQGTTVACTQRSSVDCTKGAGCGLGDCVGTCADLTESQCPSGHFCYWSSGKCMSLAGGLGCDEQATPEGCATRMYCHWDSTKCAGFAKACSGLASDVCVKTPGCFL